MSSRGAAGKQGASVDISTSFYGEARAADKNIIYRQAHGPDRVTLTHINMRYRCRHLLGVSHHVYIYIWLPHDVQYALTNIHWTLPTIDWSSLCLGRDSSQRVCRGAQAYITPGWEQAQTWKSCVYTVCSMGMSKGIRKTADLLIQRKSYRPCTNPHESTELLPNIKCIQVILEYYLMFQPFEPKLVSLFYPITDKLHLQPDKGVIT